MANAVFIRIHNDYSVDWCIPGNGHEKLGQPSTTLSELADLCPGKKVIVFIPGEMVHLGSYIIPAKNRQKILQAAPFAMEDDLIGDIDDFHFALPAKTLGKNIAICAIEKARMVSILSLLKKYDIQPQTITIDTLALNWQAETWTLLLEDNVTTIRTNLLTGFTVDTSSLRDYIDIAIDEAGEHSPSKMSVIDARTLDAGQTIESLLPDSMTIQNITPQESIIYTFASSYVENETINLLQGNYAVKHIRHQNLKKWYPAAAILIAFLLVKLIGGIFEYKQLTNQVDNLDHKIERLFRQALPDVKRIVNPKAQMTQRLISLKSNNQNGQTDFFTHFAKSVKPLKADKSIVIKTINFRNNHLDIELNISDLQALEKLKQTIAQTGSKVEIRSAAVQGKQVSARLRITGEAS